MLLVEGPRVVAELLDSPVRSRALLHQESPAGAIDALVERFRASDVPCHALPDSQLTSVCDAAAPQGVVAVAEIPSWRWEDLGPGHLIVLDAVQDPGNVGTLLRAAEGLGIGGVVVLPGTADPWSPKVTRAAAGSTLRLPIVEATWEKARERLTRDGFQLWAADAGGESLRDARATPRVALVLGNEGAGVSQPVLRAVHRTVSVPLRSPVDSLNVGVAGAILMDRLGEGRRDG